MITALIIDDEPLAHKVIENYAKDIPYLSISGNAYDALEAHQLLNNQSVDLIFLDIHLPKIKGLDFLKMIPNPPTIIITSAYDNYALEGYELNVCDYLLKPYDFERFIKAVNKAARLNKPTPPQKPTSTHPPKHFFVKSGKKHLQINYKDILYLKAYGSYTKIYLAQEMILASERIAYFEKSLPDGFIRIHKSYMVAVAHIKSVEGNRLAIGEEILPIGNFYKQQVLKLL